MKHVNDNKPECFGDLDIVFPMGDDGLRQTPPDCFRCPDKTECLRTGLRGQAGLKIHEEHIDRSYQSGMISFVERWSRKKRLEQRRQSENEPSLIGKLMWWKKKQL